MPNTKLFLYFNESINPKRGIPVIYAFVPSMGSIIQVYGEFLLSKPPSSPNMLCVGNFFCINFLTFFSIRRSTFVTNSFLILFIFSALEIFLI